MLSTRIYIDEFAKYHMNFYSHHRWFIEFGYIFNHKSDSEHFFRWLVANATGFTECTKLGIKEPKNGSKFSSFFRQNELYKLIASTPFFFGYYLHIFSRSNDNLTSPIEHIVLNPCNKTMHCQDTCQTERKNASKRKPFYFYGRLHCVLRLISTRTEAIAAFYESRKVLCIERLPMKMEQEERQKWTEFICTPNQRNLIKSRFH